MYHGSPNATFTKFRSGSYFTQDKDYTKAFTFVSSIAKALRYKQNKGVVAEEVSDNEATAVAIRNSINESEYKKMG